MDRHRPPPRVACLPRFLPFLKGTRFGAEPARIRRLQCTLTARLDMLTSFRLNSGFRWRAQRRHDDVGRVLERGQLGLRQRAA